MNFSNLFEKEDVVFFGDVKYNLESGVYTSIDLLNKSSTQKQTEDTFSFKWKKEDTFDSKQSLERMKNWLIERYQEPEKWTKTIESKSPTLLDAGCGAGMSGFEYWSHELANINYVGVDISDAVYVASKRANDLNFNNVAFVQSNLDNLPFPKSSFDIIFSEGVLHHTDSTKNSFSHLSKLLKPKGVFMFYIYKKKGPIREFSDDYIREKLQSLSPKDAWEKLEPLTHLGIELGNLNIEVNIPYKIDLLEIPAGKIDIQRLFYWYFLKAFFDPKLSFHEMHHINFDWHAPKNAHRHTVKEVRSWCQEQNLAIELLKEEMAGITCIARKQS